MRILLVYPEHPRQTYWSFSGAMRLIGRRASMPPLGLITVAALLPDDVDVELVDLNVEELNDEQIRAADLVMTSSMVVQAPSLARVIERCKRLGVPVAAGGPHPTSDPDDVSEADYLILGEAEEILPRFIDSFRRGEAERITRADRRPAVTRSPIPRFDLLAPDAYSSMAVQYSRGCPFECEFCDIWTLYGRKPRVKENAQVLAELQALYDGGWRGSVFFVDDNFIGNRKLVRSLLSDLQAWQRAHDFPFGFFTEASVNLAGDERLLASMRDAGFNLVFLGIETPSAESLAGANKGMNMRLDLLEAVRTIQGYGIEVASGFIVGFDEDTDDIFDRQIDFIQRAGIPMAMVGILTALHGTVLHERLGREGRLLADSAGNNTHAFSANFVTRMAAERLAAGYRRVLQTLYDRNLRNYFDRCRVLFSHLGENDLFARPVTRGEILMLLRSLATIPRRRYGLQYLRFLLWTLVRHPGHFPEAVRLGIMGEHFHGMTRQAIARQDVEAAAARWLSTLGERIAQLAAQARESTVRRDAAVRKALRARMRAFREVQRKLRRLGPEARAAGIAAYRNLVERVDRELAAHLPTWVPRGAERLAELRESFNDEVARLRQRYAEVRRRAGVRIDDVQRDVERIMRERREILRAARRRVRELPAEYRLLGRAEVEWLREALDNATPLPAPA